MLSLFLELFGLFFRVYLNDRYDFIVFSHHGLYAALDAKLLEKCLLHGSQGVSGEFRVFTLRDTTLGLFVEMRVRVRLGVVSKMLGWVIFYCYNGWVVVVRGLVRH